MANRVCIVTGASRGIGRAIAIALAQDGDTVVVNYAGREEDARETARLVEEAHGKAMVVKADVGVEADVEKMVQATMAEFGRLDVLVNNAGITRDGLLMRMKDADWDAVLNTNLKGAFHMIRAAAKPMMKARYGRIVNVSSVVALMGNAGQANYVAAKSGLIGLTKSSARELAPRNITVNAVAPGFIQTEMTERLGEEWQQKTIEEIPLGRIGVAVDVARAVRFLASDEADYITGQVLNIDGGMVM